MFNLPYITLSGMTIILASPFLARKDYHFEKVVMENLLVHSAATTIVKTTDNRRILIVFVYIICNCHTEQLGQDLKALASSS